MSQQSQPCIEITPEHALIDEKVNVFLRNFTPHQRVTLRASVTDDLGKLWASHAVVQTNAEGTLDLSKQAPSAGTYDTIDPMGLFWSMTPAKEADRGSWFVQGAKPLTVRFTAEVDGMAVSSAHAERLYLALGVTRSVVRENGLAGVFFKPNGPGPFPAIMVFSGSGGGVQEWRAALYAAHGYAAFALAYFAYESLPSALREIPLEYFETAIHWLQAQAGIDGKRLAASGASRGGELVLLLGATYPQIKAVIGYVPSGLVWRAAGADPTITGSSWSYKGQALPYVPDVHDPAIEARRREQKLRGEPIDLTPGFLAALSATPPSVLEAATIPVENAHCAFLLISGTDDQMWPSTKMAQMVIDRLVAHHYRYPYKHLAYEGAGHMILAPYTPVITSGVHPVSHNLHAYGGSPSAYAHAFEDSWSQILQFLAENLKQ